MGISSQSAVFCSRKGLEAQSEGWGHTSWRLSQTRPKWGSQFPPPVHRSPMVEKMQTPLPSCDCERGKKPTAKKTMALKSHKAGSGKDISSGQVLREGASWRAGQPEACADCPPVTPLLMLQGDGGKGPGC